MASAVAPIFDNNPSFSILTIDKKDKKVSDFQTHNFDLPRKVKYNVHQWSSMSMVKDHGFDLNDEKQVRKRNMRDGKNPFSFVEYESM